MKIISTVFISLLLACQGPSSGRPQLSDSSGASDTILMARKAPDHPARMDTTSLAGTWVLQPVLASDTATGRRPTLHLDLAKHRFSGNTGCNQMNGMFWYSNKDSSLTFSDKIMTTRMACPGYNEPAFLKSLLHTSNYRLSNGILILLSDGNTELSRWERKASVAPKAIKA